jgi:uncharacterized protein DUF4340
MNSIDEQAHASAAVTKGPDPRARVLKILIALAVVLSILAVIAHGVSGEKAGPQFETRLVWPQFESSLDAIAKLEVTSKEERFTIELGDDGIWGVKERGGYPVRPEQLRATLWGLGDLKIIERKTSRPERHKSLGLGDPGDGGDGVLYRVMNRDGAVFVSVVMGVPEGSETLGGELRNYLRMDGDNQTWLAEGRLEPQASLEEWLDLDFLEVSSDRIARVTSTPGIASEGGEVFSISRPDEATYNFAFPGLAPGKEMTGPTAANGLGRVLVALTFTDVLPAAQVGFDGAAEARFETFDGLVLVIKTQRFEEEFWISIEAQASPQASPLENAGETTDLSQTGDEVARINGRAAGWAFKIPDWKGRQLTLARGSLIKQKEETASELND